MAYCHAWPHYHVIHRDLKPENILLKAGEIKLADFGVSWYTDRPGAMPRTYAGTPAYMAPEVGKMADDKEVPYTEAVDIWSLSLISVDVLFWGDPDKTRDSWPGYVPLF